MIQRVILPAEVMQALMIAFGLCLFTCSLELSHLGFEQALLGRDRGMMFVRLDAQRFAECRQEMILVHLCVALNRLVRELFGQIAQFRNGLLLQLFVATYSPTHLRAQYHRR